MAYNLLCVVPLLAYGPLSDRMLPLVLGALGVGVGVWRLATFLVELVDNETTGVLIRFGTLGLAGVGAVAGGLAYQAHQKTIRAWVDEQAGRMCGSCRVARKSAGGDDGAASASPTGRAHTASVTV